MDMVIISTILRRYENTGFNVRGGDIVKLYENGYALLENDDMSISVYIRSREV